MTKRIILGSNSPRRRELLAGLDVEFVVDTGNNFEESFPEGTPHSEIPVIMSRGKSYGFHRALEEEEILLTADTVVLLPSDNRDSDGAADARVSADVACLHNGKGGMIMGKPHSREEAVAMLRMLSAHTHEVITAVTIRDGKGRCETFSDSTLVSFRNLSDEEIDYYLDTYRPYDKAGSYGVQEWIGYVAIEGIRGSFYNVMGFPVHKVYTELQKFLKD